MSNMNKKGDSNKNFTQKIGERIKQARQEVGYSQKELGEALQLSDRTVSAYEVGRAQPSLSILKELSRVTSRPIGYFLDELEYSEIDLQLKVKRIEQELLEVKKVLKKK